MKETTRPGRRIGRWALLGLMVPSLVLIAVSVAALFGETKITALDAIAGDEFGISTAADGSRFVVGAHLDGGGGSAYVFDADGFGGFDETKLTPLDGVSGDLFGWSVALSGDRVVVGAYEQNGNGAAYVYDADGGGGFDQTKLTASDADSGDAFGLSVAVDGDLVVVGAPTENDPGTNSGTVYLYEADGNGGFDETMILTASDVASGDRFGYAVAVSGARFVVGSYLDDDEGTDSGSAYVYDPDGFGDYTETKLTASDGATGDRFGWSVAVSGDRIVVGAYLDDGQGSAYVFEADGLGGYTETEKLVATDIAADDNFGYAVAVNGDVVVVGSYLDDDDGGTSGSVYAFDSDGVGGFDETKVTATDAEAGDRFGWAVAASTDFIVAGAPREDAEGSNAGAAYVLAPDADGDGVADASDNCPSTVNADQADNDGDGLGDVCDDDDDNDGLSDVEEGVLGTDPFNEDTDSDGVLDGSDNCALTSNSGQADFDEDGLGDVCDDDDDNDGLSDVDEGVLGTDPFNADTDGDGLDDGVDPFPLNVAPTATGLTKTVSESVAVGTTIGTVVGSDSDGDPLTYSITAGNSSGLFSVGATTGVVKTAGILDFDVASQHVLTVSVADGKHTVTAEATVNVTSAGTSSPPSATGFTVSVAENVAVGTTVGTVTATDDDGDPLSYSITDGNPSGLFGVGTDGGVTVAKALDYETQTQHVLTVTVSDGTQSVDATVTVNVTDIGGALDVVVDPDADSFDDDDDSIFEKDIEWLFAAGITKGCADRQFCAEDNVTRGQMAAFLKRALTLPATATDYFTDDDTSIFEGDINRLAESGITKGCGPETFCPTGLVTRGQMAAFLVRALNLPTTDVDFFSDDDGTLFEKDINRLAASGITKGCGAETFCPNSFVTRGQMAAFLKRALN